MNTTKKKPFHSLKVGMVKAAIWRNETPFGPRFNTTFSRVYRKDDQWHVSDSFGRDDLLSLAKLADLAHSFIVGQEGSAAPLTLQDKPSASEIPDF